MYEKHLVNTQTLLARYVERIAPGNGDDVANDWIVSVLRRLQSKRPSSVRRFLEDIGPQITDGHLPYCLRSEGRKRARNLLRRRGASLHEEDLQSDRMTDVFLADSASTPVQDFVASLPGRWQQAIRLRAEGMPMTAIAREMNTPERTLRHWMSRVRQLATKWPISPPVTRSRKVRGNQ
jgi:DNA-directed RNA polymerase specialized sigma24 family protein